jgi:sugar lactone lactonase YvrE
MKATTAASVMVLLGCGAAMPAARSQDHGEIQELLYDTASERAKRGDLEGALAILEQLDTRGWTFCPADRDMADLVKLPRYRALCARMKARAPQVSRAGVAMTLADPGMRPEGIAYDDDHEALFMGSVARRKIVRITSDGEVRDFVPSGTGIYAVLGVRVDAAHGLLWAATAARPSMEGYDPRDEGKAALLAFALDSGAPRLSLPLTDGGKHMLNDVAIAPDGTAYVTDTESGAVWRHRAADTGLVEFLPAGALRAPNGIACDGQRLLVAHASGVTVVALASGARAELAVPVGTTLGGLDGLYVDGDVLLGVQNGFGSPRVVRAELDAEHATAQWITVLDSMHPALGTVTTAALVRRDRRLLVLARGNASPAMILSVPVDP